MLLQRLKRQGFQVEDGAKPGHLTFHSTVTAESQCDYRGETWAELDGIECGHVKWHSDEHTTSIDYIETGGQVPLLGVRLIKTVLDDQKQQLDPGMMNEAGKRLWWLFCERYSYYE
jgi:hypothetical protein